MWSVLLTSARQFPQSRGPLWVQVPYLGVYVERPIEVRDKSLHGAWHWNLAYRPNLLLSELFLVTRMDPDNQVAEARYVGLRRPHALMSETEKRLSPMRFPQ